MNSGTNGISPFLTVLEAGRLMFPDLTPTQAARRLYRWASHGALPATVIFRVGSSIIVRRRALFQWMNAGDSGSGETSDASSGEDESK